jgi:hypothetical protein
MPSFHLFSISRKAVRVSLMLRLCESLVNPSIAFRVRSLILTDGRIWM